MKIAENITKMRDLRIQMQGSVGFVPTMGYLHEGHLELVRRARKANDHVIASIFVNPTQFAPHEDLDTYPRDEERDLDLLKAEGVDAVFFPTPQIMYPRGFDTWVTVKKVSEPLEGSSRPHFFQGVATVVNKLFNITQPHKAYFGQKDAQQLLVIKKMVRDLDMPLEVVPVPIIREKDGLAMSSRNAYLSSEERASATVLYRSLQLAEKLWRGGVVYSDNIKQAMKDLISAEKCASVDYISIADANSLEELDEIKTPALISMAVFVGQTRLIDNIILES